MKNLLIILVVLLTLGCESQAPDFALSVPEAPAQAVATLVDEAEPLTELVVPREEREAVEAEGRAASDFEEDAPAAPEETKQLTLTTTGGADCEGDRVGPVATKELIALTDVSAPMSLQDVRDRINGVAARFGACQDRRGLFAEVYRVITRRALEALDAQVLEYNEWGADFIIDFGKRYLDNLHRHLVGGKPNYGWKRYYDLAQMPNVSRTRIAVVGMVAHLAVDLPYCLVEIETHEEHKADYFLFGDKLGEGAEELIVALDEVYGAKANDLLRGFFLGKWVDGVFGPETATNLSFQTLRLKSWNNRWFMQKWWGMQIAKTEMGASFWTIDAILASLDASGVLNDD